MANLKLKRSALDLGTESGNEVKEGRQTERERDREMNNKRVDEEIDTIGNRHREKDRSDKKVERY